MSLNRNQVALMSRRSKSYIKEHRAYTEKREKKKTQSHLVYKSFKINKRSLYIPMDMTFF